MGAGTDPDSGLGWESKNVTAQQHRICFAVSHARLAVTGLLMCNSTLRRPLPRISGTAARVLSGG